MNNGLAIAMFKQKKFSLFSIFSIFSLFSMLMLLSSHVFASDRVITIVPDVAVVKMDMRSEIVTMMENLGYALQPVIDPATGLQTSVTEKLGKYRMLFFALDNSSVRVEARIRKKNGNTSLYFSYGKPGQSGSSADDYYSVLHTRVVQEFGADNVEEQ